MNFGDSQTVQVEEMLETDKTAEPTRNTHTVSEAIEPGLVILIHMIHMIHIYTILYICIQLYSIVFNSIHMYVCNLYTCTNMHMHTYVIQLYDIVYALTEDHMNLYTCVDSILIQT